MSELITYCAFDFMIRPIYLYSYIITDKHWSKIVHNTHLYELSILITHNEN